MFSLFRKKARPEDDRTAGIQPDIDGNENADGNPGDQAGVNPEDQDVGNPVDQSAVNSGGQAAGNHGGQGAVNPEGQSACDPADQSAVNPEGQAAGNSEDQSANNPAGQAAGASDNQISEPADDDQNSKKKKEKKKEKKKKEKKGPKVLFESEKIPSLFKFRGAVFDLLIYELLSKFILNFGVSIFNTVSGLLLWHAGLPALTSGDVPYLMRTWEGWLLIVAGCMLLFLYTAFDISAVILIADSVLHGREIKTLDILRKAMLSMAAFINPRGIFFVLYVALLGPLCGIGMGISLTKNFFIPEFITSVIYANKLYRNAYYAVLALLFIYGFVHIFTFQFVVLGKQKLKDAMRLSRQALRKHWGHFLLRTIGFELKLAIVVVFCIAFLIMPPFIASRLVEDQLFSRTLLITSGRCVKVFIWVYGLIFLYYSTMFQNTLYEESTGEKYLYRVIRRKRHFIFLPVVLLTILGILMFSYVEAEDFDRFYPITSEVGIVAHRGGGELGNENTIIGLNLAIEAGADYSEIDVQRTKDGHYIINHDNDFLRCCGDPHKPGELTLEEIKQLRVVNAWDPEAPTAEVATIEEYLDAAKGKINLLIELKGVSADLQMAEDVYQMVVERDMLDQCMFICLEDDLLEELEEIHPEAQTGYLCFMSFGNIEKMAVDALLLEEETATPTNIYTLHDAGKKVGVWTVNSHSGMRHFLMSDADMIITDKVSEAQAMRVRLTEDDDVARVSARYLDN